LTKTLTESVQITAEVIFN